MVSLAIPGAYPASSRVRALCPVNLVRARAWSVGGLFQWKNTSIQASSPAVLISQFKQASSVGGLIATRLLRTGTGSCARFFGNSFRSFVQKSEQPASCLRQCFVLPVWLPPVHRQHHDNREFVNVRNQVGKGKNV